MKTLTNLLGLYKTYSKEISTTKLIVLVIVNTWLLIIFWKILLIDNVFIGKENIALTKMQTMLQPVLMYLGLDILSPNTIKLLIITIVILTVNITVLHFNQMVAIIITLGIARYGYKSYTNYLINSENMMQIESQIPTQASQITQKAVEQAPIVINTGASSGTNWWLWGTVIVIGVIAIGGIAFTIWSHNTNATNMLEVNNNVKLVNTSLGNVYNDLNDRIDNVVDKMDKDTISTSKLINEVNVKTSLIDNKTKELESTMQIMGTNLTEVSSLQNENTLKLSQQALNLSNQAKEAISEIAEASSTVEAATLGIAKLWSIIKDYNLRIEKIEDTIGIKAVETPRQTVNYLRENDY